MYHRDFLVTVESYVLKHQGHCAAGWAGTTMNKNINDCFIQCASMSKIGFFAFNSKKGECACYFAAMGCPDDDLFNDYNAYSIIEGSF